MYRTEELLLVIRSGSGLVDGGKPRLCIFYMWTRYSVATITLPPARLRKRFAGGNFSLELQINVSLLVCGTYYLGTGSGLGHKIIHHSYLKQSDYKISVWSDTK